MPGVDFHLAVHARSRAHASALRAVAAGCDRSEYGSIATSRVLRYAGQLEWRLPYPARPQQPTGLRRAAWLIRFLGMSVREHHRRTKQRAGCAVLTISDTRTEANDTSGARLKELLAAAGHQVVAYAIVPDDPLRIRDTLQ